MTWTQVSVLGFLIFIVGWVVESRLETVIRAISKLETAVEDLGPIIGRNLGAATDEITRAVEGLKSTDE